jgi:hypothetical protein
MGTYTIIQKGNITPSQTKKVLWFEWITLNRIGKILWCVLFCSTHLHLCHLPFAKKGLHTWYKTMCVLFTSWRAPIDLYWWIKNLEECGHKHTSLHYAFQQWTIRLVNVLHWYKKMKDAKRSLNWKIQIISWMTREFWSFRVYRKWLG